MAFCCFPTLLKKITSELVAIRFNRERKKKKQQAEKKGGVREENQERAEKLNLVQLGNLRLADKKEREVRESGARSKLEREKEGSEESNKSGSFKEAADNMVECKLRYIRHVQILSTF